MRVVAFVSDLMDRSRLAAALDPVEFASDPGAAMGADVVIVDLARFPGVVAPIRAGAHSVRIVAFGPHVGTEALDQAVAAGADVVLPRSQFFRDPAGAVGPGV